MKFSVLTLFPEQVRYNVAQSITGRALERSLFELQCVDIRAFSDNRYGKVDDKIFGGGKGLLMQCEAIMRARESLAGEGARCLYLSPKGRRFDQALAFELAQEKELILLCGHYEGVDDRVLQALGAEEISLGDYVLTGGELAACVLIDAVARLLPGVLPCEEAYQEESHSRGLLECRHFSQPALWRERPVPETLLSGHHARIARWRYLDGLAETLEKAPALFDRLSLDEADYADLLKHLRFERPKPPAKTAAPANAANADTPRADALCADTLCARGSEQADPRVDRFYSPIAPRPILPEKATRCRYRAVFFDLDGTLVDTVPHICESFDQACRHFSLPLLGDETYMEGIGLPLRDYIAEVFPPELQADFLTYYRRYNEMHMSKHTMVFWPAVRLLNDLKALRVPLGVVTAKRLAPARQNLQDFGLEDYFDLLISSEDTERHKPDPLPLQLALKKLNALTGENLSMAEILYVGDSRYDIACAKNAGCDAALVQWTRMPLRPIDEAGPYFVLYDASDLQ